MLRAKNEQPYIHLQFGDKYIQEAFNYQIGIIGILQTAHDISTTWRKVLRSIAQHPLPLLYHYHPPVHFLHNATLLLGIACPRLPASKKMYCMPRGRFSSNGIQKTGRRWYERPAEQTSLSLSLAHCDITCYELSRTSSYNQMYCIVFYGKICKGGPTQFKMSWKTGYFLWPITAFSSSDFRRGCSEYRLRAEDKFEHCRKFIVTF